MPANSLSEYSLRTLFWLTLHWQKDGKHTTKRSSSGQPLQPSSITNCVSISLILYDKNGHQYCIPYNNLESNIIKNELRILLHYHYNRKQFALACGFRVLRNNQLNGTLDLGSNYSDQLQRIDFQNNLIVAFIERAGFKNKLM